MPGAARPSSDRAAAALVVGLFLALGLVGVLNHEMWRDELEIWLIARDSPSLGDLVRNLRTEGHPALWYLLNFALTRVTDIPLAMQLLNLSLGAAAVALFVLYAPFGTLQRLLFCFGYFALYEFTVISRSYALALLLSFLFCALFQRRGRIDGTSAAALLLLANTTLYGTIFAAHMILLVLLHAALQGRLSQLLGDRRQIASLGLVALGVIVGFGHTLVQSLAIGPAHAAAYGPQWNPHWLLRGIATVWYGAVPLPDPTVLESWNSNLLQLLPTPWDAVVGAAFALPLLVLFAAALRSKPAVSAVFVLGTLTQLSIVLFVWYGSARHHGQVFVWFLLCVWLWRGLDQTSPEAAATPAPASRGPTAGVLTGLLALQAVAGAYAFARDLAHPFSNAEAAGRFLRGADFDDVTLVGSIDYSVQPIAAFIDRPFYYPESKRFGTFIEWGPTRELVPLGVVLEDALRLMRSGGRDVVVVFNYAPRGMQPGDRTALGGGARMRCFARFTGALVADENYHLCHVYQRAPTAGPGAVDSPPTTNDNYQRAEHGEG